MFEVLRSRSILQQWISSGSGRASTMEAGFDDLPCPWCRAETAEGDVKCPSCGRRFG